MTADPRVDRDADRGQLHAMFPLGNAVLPGEVLPLRIFEPRYRKLLVDCLEANVGFGTVLIDRGSEVGGGDVRRDIGVLCRFVRIEPQLDGSFIVLALGVGRIRVVRWLDDDPYPHALIEAWSDDDRDAASEAYRKAVALGPQDRYEVLGAPDTDRRAAALADALETWELTRRFAADESPPGDE
jgi:uncharacterized protein